MEGAIGESLRERNLCERERDEQIERMREYEKFLSKTNIWSFNQNPSLSLVGLHTNSHFSHFSHFNASFQFNLHFISFHLYFSTYITHL